MNTEETVKSDIRAIITSILDGNPVIDNNERLVNQGVHSLLIMNVLVTVEEHFSIVFEDEEMDISNFDNVNMITSKVMQKLSQHQC